MSKGSREQNIRRIIEMEDRICQCQRCTFLIKCVRKPSMGKGELEPDIMLVFEYDNQFTKELENIIELRNQIKHSIKLDKIYHTYMVRCQPKACSLRNSVSCYADKKLLDKEYRCLLSNRQCDGIPINPGSEETISCLPFLLEEIEILHPRYIILFGNKVSEFVLKSYGIFEDIELEKRYRFDDIMFITTVSEDSFETQHLKQVTKLINE